MLVVIFMLILIVVKLYVGEFNQFMYENYCKKVSNKKEKVTRLKDIAEAPITKTKKQIRFHNKHRKHSKKLTKLKNKRLKWKNRLIDKQHREKGQTPNNQFKLSTRFTEIFIDEDDNALITFDKYKKANALRSSYKNKFVKNRSRRCSTRKCRL